MRFNKAIAAVLGLSMAVTPVLAQTSAPLAQSRAGVAMQDASSLDNDDYLLPGLVLIAILTAAILLTNKESDHNNPVSN